MPTNSGGAWGPRVNTIRCVLIAFAFGLLPLRATAQADPALAWPRAAAHFFDAEDRRLG